MKRFRNKILMKRAITFLFVLVTVFTIMTPFALAEEIPIDPNVIEDVSSYS